MKNERTYILYIPGQMTIEDFLGDLKDGGEKDMS